MHRGGLPRERNRAPAGSDVSRLRCALVAVCALTNTSGNQFPPRRSPVRRACERTSPRRDLGMTAPPTNPTTAPRSTPPPSCPVSAVETSTPHSAHFILTRAFPDVEAVEVCARRLAGLAIGTWSLTRTKSTCAASIDEGIQAITTAATVAASRIATRIRIRRRGWWLSWTCVFMAALFVVGGRVPAEIRQPFSTLGHFGRSGEQVSPFEQDADDPPYAAFSLCAGTHSGDPASHDETAIHLRCVRQRTNWAGRLAYSLHQWRDGDAGR